MKMKKYIKNLITLINYERDAEIDLMTREISTMSGQKREELGRAINKVKGKSLGKELGLQICQVKKGRNWAVPSIKLKENMSVKS